MDLQKKEATIEMESHVLTEKLQYALKDHPKYQLNEQKNFDTGNALAQPKLNVANDSVEQGEGIYDCPMRCEGDKTYDKPGNCPVCGMHLIV